MRLIYAYLKGLGRVILFYYWKFIVLGAPPALLRFRLTNYVCVGGCNFFASFFSRSGVVRIEIYVLFEQILI